ncbi:MAG: L-threonylcarbamoyladenylate synthase [Tenuifilaceae bacterium]|jgi:tRNA threonylcarbamoyl adenosine modification protein (Sua5/YciO/YrdC/YwlC family)|uniref:L-threonylcarbamoyladenylate synthase n=1 Tax=Perlabentimonas gracilis TaxID=2715279 RepID=UPI00140BBE73|nr:L-threonylcarbamoyladenylate synthase [Perlabentimonas gracilis]MDX9771308.1 L-threonylcarbamoyladenylate synthase [Tenuifilaceae bacterium]NHB67402.1 threonylcarbamoyl-AMP synthase [Perlabentimonas gracilis]
MLIKIYPENPNPRDLDQVVDVLQNGGVIIYPTDTVYGIGCDISKPKAVERIIKIKEMKPKEARFSFICSDLSHIADYARIDNSTFKLLKRNLPGPFTFILPGLNRVPDYFISKRKTVGIRIPDNSIILELVKLLGNPILTTSLKDDDEVIEYTTDPELIYEKYQDLVDVVIDGGYGGNIPSTIVDCTEAEPTLVREGKGEVIW